MSHQKKNNSQLSANSEMLEVLFGIEKLPETYLELLKTSQGGTGHLTYAIFGHTKNTNTSILIEVLLKVGHCYA